MTSAGSQPTRRTVVRTAAWTAPAVALSAAAPAHASSGPRLVFMPGQTSGGDGGTPNPLLSFRQASVHATGGITPPTFTMTITWPHDFGGDDLFAVADIPNMTGPSLGTRAKTLVYTATAAPPTGFAIADSTPVRSLGSGSGSFVLLFEAPGYASTTWNRWL